MADIVYMFKPVASGKSALRSVYIDTSGNLITEDTSGNTKTLGNVEDFQFVNLSTLTSSVTTAYANITGASFTVGANETWIVEGDLLVSNLMTDYMDLRLKVTVPASATMYGHWSDTWADDMADLTSPYTVTINTTAFQRVPLKAVLKTGSTAGTVQIQLSNATSTAAAVKVLANSILKAYKKR